MTPLEFLEHLRSLKIELRAEQGRLRCSAPKGVLTPVLEQEIGRRKEEILRVLQLAELSHADELPPIAPRDRARFERLSFAQERLWFLNRLEPDSTAYNLTISRSGPGTIDPDCLARSLRELVRRHEVLRSRFVERDGTPVQETSPDCEVPLNVLDLAHMSRDARRPKLDEISANESQIPFDLERGPVIRSVLAQSGDTHVLFVSLPHIVCDGWSFGVLMHELTLLYSAFSSGRESPLPDLPIQYGDFAEWQRQLIKGDRLQHLLEFWRAQIAGATQELRLPAREDAGAGKARAAVTTFTLDGELSSRVRERSRAERVTDFVTLLAAYGLVLERYSGEETFLVGTPFANRRRPETESLIGLFANVVALRIDTSGNPTVRAYLSRLQDTLLDVHANQDMPFEKLVEQINPGRRHSGTPLFQTTFVFQNTPGSSEFTVQGGGSIFDLALYVWDEPGGFRGAIEYRADLFTRRTIDRLVASFRTLIARMVEAPSSPIDDLDALGEEDVAAVHRWNDSGTAYPRENSVIDCFEQVVRDHPQAPALVGGNLNLSYGELQDRADRLAATLCARGLVPGTRVGLFVERSAEAVTGMLAILKAGGCYVPLDPGFPGERLELISKLADLEIFVTRRSLVSRVPAQGRVVVSIDDDPAQSDSGQLPRSPGPDDTAYVMFTSGSTGIPKGVLIRHRSIVRLVRNTNYVDLGPNETLLQYAPLSFDASTFEIWGALLNGGCLVIPPPGALTLSELGHCVRDSRVTTLWLTAGLFHEVVDAGLEDYRGVRQLLAGGDVLSPGHVRRALTALDGCVVVNGYGPTENTTFTCCHRIKSLDDVGSKVAIGRPIANSTAYILDKRDRLAPIGAIGELCAGGDGVAVGYLGDPVLTGRRFFDSEFGRLYRTGDLVRYRDDGQIDFMGRVDDQLKIRGFRVEPGEVESVLCSYGEVSEAAVLPRDIRQGVKALFAFVKPAGNGIDLEKLQRELKRKLPAYLVPQHIVIVDRFPLTSNGKVDKSAMANLDLGPSSVTGGVRGAPRDQMEVQLCAIWEQVLDIPDVGIFDDFFELGGHSLLAVKLFSQIGKVFRRELPLATLFNAPTVAGLAEILREQGWQAPWRSLVAIQPAGSKLPLFLIPGVGGNVLMFAHFANRLGTDQPVYGLQARGLDGAEQPLDRIEEMASAYLEEIRAVQPSGPYRVAGACMGGAVAFEIAQRLVAEGQRVEFLALIETWAPATLDRSKRRISAMLHPLVFLISRTAEHLKMLKNVRPRQWIAFFRERFGMVQEMLAERDIYRGDRRILHQDVVSSASYRAMATYEPRPFPGRVQIFVAAGRPLVAEKDPRLMWGDLAAQGYSLHCIEAADSGMLFLEPHVDELARQFGLEGAAQSNRK